MSAKVTRMALLDLGYSLAGAAKIAPVVDEVRAATGLSLSNAIAYVEKCIDQKPTVSAAEVLEWMRKIGAIS